MLRALRRISQRELARQTGVHHSRISQFERGRTGLSPRSLGRLLDALEVTPRALEATERHVQWIDFLSSAESTGRDRQALMLAESVARSFEVHTAALLQLVDACTRGGR
jgi:transcriptional regulator with XRE-family HTH domain